MAKRTQRQAVREHLERHGRITPLEALNLYGCFRLAAVIFTIRQDLALEGKGWTVETVDTPQANAKYPHPADFATYVLRRPDPKPEQLTIF